MNNKNVLPLLYLIFASMLSAMHGEASHANRPFLPSSPSLPRRSHARAQAGDHVVIVSRGSRQLQQEEANALQEEIETLRAEVDDSYAAIGRLAAQQAKLELTLKQVERDGDAQAVSDLKSRLCGIGAEQQALMDRADQKRGELAELVAQRMPADPYQPAQPRPEAPHDATAFAAELEALAETLEGEGGAAAGDSFRAARDNALALQRVLLQVEQEEVDGQRLAATAAACWARHRGPIGRCLKVISIVRIGAYLFPVLLPTRFLPVLQKVGDNMWSGCLIGGIISFGYALYDAYSNRPGWLEASARVAQATLTGVAVGMVAPVCAEAGAQLFAGGVAVAGAAGAALLTPPGLCFVGAGAAYLMKDQLRRGWCKVKDKAGEALSQCGDALWLYASYVIAAGDTM